MLNLPRPLAMCRIPLYPVPRKNLPKGAVHMKNYGFEPFETVIALITTQYISDHVSRTELV